MKALLDTNIIIHREAGRVVIQDIGILFRWLDRAKYSKCIHPVTISEIQKNPNKATVRRSGCPRLSCGCPLRLVW